MKRSEVKRMSENQQTPQSAETQPAEGAEPRKISLAEAMKQKMAQKKAAQAQANSQQKHQVSGNQMMKSQQTKKQNNQRRRMGV